MRPHDAKKFHVSEFVGYKDTNLLSCTAAAKSMFANRFVRFIQSGFRQSMFTKDFYRRLSMCFGHIAHYDQAGFWYEWFSTPANQLRWLEHCLSYRVCGDPEYTYSDVERALQHWLRESGTVTEFGRKFR